MSCEFSSAPKLMVLFNQIDCSKSSVFLKFFQNNNKTIPLIIKKGLNITKNRILKKELSILSSTISPNISTDVAYGLTDSLLILHKRKSQVALAVFAETPARSNRHLRIFHQVHSVIYAALAL